jgi:small multidrug resistance family-3 protein
VHEGAAVDEWVTWQPDSMLVLRSFWLFVLAAIAEIRGAWLVWQGVRAHRGLMWVGAGVLALAVYGFVATFQPDAHFGRILAAYGGISWRGPSCGVSSSTGFTPTDTT